MRLNLRVALFLLIGLVAIGGVWSDSQSSSSTDDKSATVVIDFGADSGREPKVIELTGVPVEETGWDLLVRAEVGVQGTAQYPTGFVCRLDGWPTVEAETCDETPAYSNGHWAYYVTSPEISKGWLLSGQGAASHVVDCGGFEGWKWVGPREEATPPSVSPELRECGP